MDDAGALARAAVSAVLHGPGVTPPALRRDDRVANTLGWDVPALGSAVYGKTAERLLRRGYR